MSNNAHSGGDLLWILTFNNEGLSLLRYMKSTLLDSLLVSPLNDDAMESDPGAPHQRMYHLAKVRLCGCKDHLG